jgi:hypothetical protein
MDRLLEASQVANLMRRRETPKPIVAGCIESAQPLVHRGFFDLKPVVSSSMQERVWPSVMPVIGRQEKPGCERFLGTVFARARSRRGAAPEARLAGRNAARWGRGGPKLRPAPGSQEPVALQSAPTTPIRFDALSSIPQYRSCNLLRQKLRAAHLPAFEANEVGVSGSTGMPKPGAFTVELTAVRGKRRQVSVQARFRGERAKLRKFTAASPAAAMIWPEELLNGFPAGISLPSIVRLAESRLAPSCARLPSSPHPKEVHGFVWPEFMPPDGTERDCRMDGRTAAMVWRLAEREALPPLLDLSTLAPPSWHAGLRRVPLLAPLAPHGVPQLSLVPIEPQQTAFDYSPIRLEVAAPAAPAAPEAPLRVATRTKLRLEENFDAKLENWVGDLTEWKVDAAGAHTGALALFVPSIELIDYDFEFLARMEGRILNWVFRAEEMTDYHAASLTVEADGTVVFNRWSVIGDVAGARFTKTLAIRIQEPKPTGKSKKAPPRKAVTVLTRVNGNHFSVTLDGEPVDQWTDNRLSIGGIGFTSTPEDRARIYWVHITSLEMQVKESHRA